MTCSEIRDQLVETARGRELSTDARAVVFKHIAGCVACARLFQNEQALARSLAVIAHHSPEAPRRIEQMLLKQLPRPIRRVPSSRRWIAAASAIAAGLAIAAVVLPHRSSAPSVQPVRPAPISTRVEPSAPSIIEPAQAPSPKNSLHMQRASLAAVEETFVPLSMSASLDMSNEAAQVVRMSIQRESLAALGFPVGANATGAVQADVLIGMDGTPRGIRLVE